MNYLLDCGTHFFEGLKKLDKIYHFDSNWTIYSFEANPITFNKSIAYKPDFPHLEHINAAISDTNGFATVYCEKHQNDCGEASNILMQPPIIDIQYNNSLEYSQTHTIATYDLYEIIKKITNHDMIVIKMDIEGSEFQVLPKIIQKSDIHIDYLYIEFHERFFPDIKKYQNLKKQYIEELKNKKTEIVLWD